MAGIQWTTYEERILIDNKDLSTKQLHGLLPGRSVSSITSRLKYLGISKPIGHRKYNIDMNFFSEPNTINSYFAGFIAADGCITPKKHLVSFGLKSSDGYILEELVKACGYEGSVGYNGTDYKRADLYIWGVKQWHEDLDKYYNITPRKSLTLMPPNITREEDIKSFIRGYIDGDGGIVPKQGLNTWVVRIRGTYEFLCWIKEFFDAEVPYRVRVLSAPYMDDGTWSYRVSGKRSLMILQKLLEVDTPYLKRKWQPVIDHLNNLPSTFYKHHQEDRK